LGGAPNGTGEAPVLPKAAGFRTTVFFWDAPGGLDERAIRWAHASPGSGRWV